ncbi:hypothetical protein GF374_00575 [Candidatus Woesearchaeota archaeon]|nr:hypothetical protein [Candidatus Woesearchaeota archaeon]
MKVFVKVKTRAKEDKVEKIDKNHFSVWVQERPIKGQANRGVIRVLADYFGIKKWQVRIVSGLTSSQKIIEIEK